MTTEPTSSDLLWQEECNRLNSQLDDLRDQLAAANIRADEAEALAQKYRDALSDIHDTARGMLR